MTYCIPSIRLKWGYPTFVAVTKMFLCCVIFVLWTGNECPCQENVFFKEYRAEFDENVSNHRGGRWRVNDEDLSLHENYGKRNEARANGLMLINIPEDLFLLNRAELYMEMWGGHPLTANKRFLVNGKQFYAIPEKGTEDNNCTYTYPVIPVKIKHLVTGINAFQFACDRGKGFWGHFIIDNASVRCYLKSDHPDLINNGLENFSARVSVPQNRIIADLTELALFYPHEFEGKITSVDFFAHYLGFDDTGNNREDDWHGFTFDHKHVNHVGSSSAAPFKVEWDTRMIPGQGKPMAVKALVHIEGGLHYCTPVADGLLFTENRKKVTLFSCSAMPKPFWSRASRKKTATITLPVNPGRIERAQLLVKAWDGGEGTVKNPFTINGHPYSIVSGKHIHDVVFTQVDVRPDHLKSGENELEILSDTEHHGIEILLPGPCLILRYK